MSSVQLFEWGSIGLWIIIILLVLTVWKKQPGLLWTVLAITLNFTLEPFYDQHFELSYSKAFIPILPRVAVPLMIPFAYGTLYVVPLLLSIWFFKKYTHFPKWLGFLIMWVAMYSLNMAQEGLCTGSGAWDYWGWSTASYGFGKQPWIVPAGVALNLPAFYYAHTWSLKASQNLESSFSKFIHHLGAVFFASLFVLIGSVIILAIYGGPK